VEASLKAKGHIEALAVLRERAGQRSAALDLLRQLAEPHPGSPPGVPGVHWGVTAPAAANGATNASSTASAAASSARQRAVRLSVRVLQGERDPGIVLQHLVWVRDTVTLHQQSYCRVLTGCIRPPPLCQWVCHFVLCTVQCSVCLAL